MVESGTRALKAPACTGPVRSAGISQQVVAAEGFEVDVVLLAVFDFPVFAAFVVR
jgi:hypothetical protein